MSKANSIDKIDEEIELEERKEIQQEDQNNDELAHEDEVEEKRIEDTQKLDELFNDDDQVDLEDNSNDAKPSKPLTLEKFFKLNLNSDHKDNDKPEQRQETVLNTFKKQLTTYFPNTVDTHIDYVIFYKTVDKDTSSQIHIEKEKVRKCFFDTLENNHGFKIYPIKFHYEKYQETFYFTLLNCSNKRLMEEAEAIKLEMTLKDVSKIVFLG
jgi:hypothetical protein